MIGGVVVVGCFQGLALGLAAPTASTSTYSQRMLDNGAYTFAPSSCANRDLPNQAPAAVAASLQHDALHE